MALGNFDHEQGEGMDERELYDLKWYDYRPFDPETDVCPSDTSSEILQLPIQL